MTQDTLNLLKINQTLDDIKSLLTKSIAQEKCQNEQEITTNTADNELKIITERLDNMQISLQKIDVMLINLQKAALALLET